MFKSHLSNFNFATRSAVLGFLASLAILLSGCSSGSGELRISNNVDDIKMSRGKITVGDEVTVSVFFSTRELAEGDRSDVNLLVKLPPSLGFKINSSTINGTGSQPAIPSEIEVCTEEGRETFVLFEFNDGELDAVGDKVSLLELRFVARALKVDPIAVVQSSAGNGLSRNCRTNTRYQEAESVQIVAK